MTYLAPKLSRLNQLVLLGTVALTGFLLSGSKVLASEIEIYPPDPSTNLNLAVMLNSTAQIDNNFTPKKTSGAGGVPCHDSAPLTNKDPMLQDAPDNGNWSYDTLVRGNESLPTPPVEVDQAKTYESTKGLWLSSSTDTGCNGPNWNTPNDTTRNSTDSRVTADWASQQILIPNNVTTITKVHQYWVVSGTLATVELDDLSGKLIAGPVSVTGTQAYTSPSGGSGTAYYFDNLNWPVIPGQKYELTFKDKGAGNLALPVNASCHGGSYWPSELDNDSNAINPNICHWMGFGLPVEEIADANTNSNDWDKHHNTISVYPYGYASGGSASYLNNSGSCGSGSQYSCEGLSNAPNNSLNPAAIARLAVWGDKIIIPSAPSLVTAGCNGGSTSNILVSWTDGDPNANDYEVNRVTDGKDWNPVFGTSFDDNTVSPGVTYQYAVRAHNDFYNTYSAWTYSNIKNPSTCDTTSPINVGGTTLQGCINQSSFPPINAWGTDPDSGVSYVTGYAFKDTPPSMSSPTTWSTTAYKVYSTPYISSPPLGYSSYTISSFTAASFQSGHVYYMTYSATNPAGLTGYSTATPESFWISNACSPFFQTKNGDVHSNGTINVNGTAPAPGP